MAGVEKKAILINDVAFEVNYVGYRAYTLLTEGYSPVEVVDLLCREGFSLDVAQVVLLEQKIQEASQKQRKSDSIYSLFSVSTEYIQPLVKYLVKLFHPLIFWGLIVLHLVVGIQSSVFDVSFQGYFEFIYTNPWLLLVYIVINALILFVHEVGHVSAAYKCRVPVDKIGVGLYLSYLVFYTDVTNSWLAERKERLLIDVSGLYFQLFLSVLFLLGSVLCPGDWTLFWSLLFWDNLIIMLFNINPFAMFDGYWVVSDFFEIKNLRQRSLKGIAELSLWMRLRVQLQSHPMLYAYAMLNAFFILGVYTLSTWRLFVNAESLGKHLMLEVVSVKEIVFLGGKVVFLAFVWWYFTKMIYNYGKVIRAYIYE